MKDELPPLPFPFIACMHSIMAPMTHLSPIVKIFKKGKYRDI
jgi:hypothetical protein